MKFRNLNPEEIECRVASIKENGVTLLLYKTARTDANILDEEIKPENWKNDFKEIGGVLYGGIAIKDTDTGEWVYKWDCGVESYTEKDKGRASDAFKRAGFKWGIGRELYTAPFIWIPKSKAKITEKSGKYVCYDKFSVKEIKYKDDKIVGLKLFNEKSKMDCYSFGDVTKTKRPSVSSMLAQLKTAGFEKNWKELLVQNYGIKIEDGMTNKQIFDLLSDEQIADCATRCIAEIKKREKAEKEQMELDQASTAIQGAYANE